LHATVAHPEIAIERVLADEHPFTLPAPPLAAVVVGVPLVLEAFGAGLGTAVASWLAPWALAAAVPYATGRQPGRAVALVVATVALLAGAAPVAGAVAGLSGAELVSRGASVRRALLVAALAAAVTLVLLTLRTR